MSALLASLGKDGEKIIIIIIIELDTMYNVGLDPIEMSQIALINFLLNKSQKFCLHVPGKHFCTKAVRY